MLYTEAITGEQMMLKITNIDETRRLFWHYKQPEIKINLLGKNVRIPANRARLLTTQQVKETMEHWHRSQNRSAMIKYIVENITTLPPAIVTEMYLSLIHI